MNPLSPFRMRERRVEDDQTAALISRARHLRETSDELLRFQEKLRDSAANLDAREVKLTEREARLDQFQARLERLEEKLAQRERGLAQRHVLTSKAVEAKRDLEAARDAPSMPNETRITDPRALAAQIIDAGGRRRGELPQLLPPLSGVAALIVAAAAKARGEPPPCHLILPEVGAAEIGSELAKDPKSFDPIATAAKIIEAGKRRRGEIQ